MSGVAREAMEDVAPAPGVGEFGVASCGVLLASVVGVIFGPTGLVISSFSLFIEPIAADLDWDRGQSALPVTLLGLAVALSSPLKGWLVDRWGARALVLPLTAALALCLASLALARSGWQLYLLFALLGLLTPGNIPYARILGGWFERRRGAAYGILGLGFGVGGPLALYLGSACIDAFGWRATFLVYGLLEGLLALPLLYALFRERPGDLPQARRPPADALPGATPGQAWRSADFWLIVGNLILGVFAVTGVMVHGVPLLQERGLSREVATDVLAALWVGMIVSQPALGYLLDRYDTPRIALPFALLAALGLLLLLLGGPPALLWGAVFLIGLGAGGETGTTQYFVSRYFGLRHFSVIYGSIQPFTFAIAISLGSWLLGYFYDRAGSYAGRRWSCSARSAWRQGCWSCSGAIATPSTGRHAAMGETERSRAEVGVWLLAGLAFVVGTVELVVAGVLDELAASFAVSQGRAGLLMSLYALVYALLGPLLVYLSAGIERRRLLAGALLAFIGANLASAAAPSFALLLASRLLVAASASVIVVVAITLAVAIVAPERRGRAIGLVFAGIVASLVLGVPLGTLIGEFWGWRSLFLLLAGVALLGLPLLLRLLPAIPGAPGIAPAEQLRALARGRVPFAHLASLLQMTGQFTVYTYIVPFLVGSMALDKPTISLVLLVYGGGGILGALLGGRAADRWPGPATFVAFLLLHALALVLLPFATGGLPLLLGAVVFWCVFNMAPGPAIQKYLVELSPDTAAIQISLNTSAIQLGVALGAFIGAILVDQVAVRALPWWGAALILGAAACGWLSAQRPAAGTADCRERLD